MDYVKSLRYLHRVLDFHEYIQFSEENDKQKLEIYESYIAKGELNQNYGYNKLANRDEIREGTPVSIAIIPKWFEGGKKLLLLRISAYFDNKPMRISAICW